MKQPLSVFFLLLTGNILYAQTDTFGLQLQNYTYPYPVHYMHTTVQNEPVEIAYMYEKAATPNGKTIMLLHGKNFPAAYWGSTIKELTGAGYDVLAPDALGFGKSSKPIIQYSFSLLAALDKQLLDTLQIKQVAIIGHSTGGMLAARFTLEYPDNVSKLILADAIGLEDWRAAGVPYRKTDVWYKEELNASYDSVLAYHKQYYAHWKDEYKIWANLQYGMTQGKQASQYAWVSALTYDMIFTQPVVYEFPHIKVPTLVIVGKQDKTKIARGASPEVSSTLGDYKTLGRKTADAIPGAKLIEYDGSGHLPFFEHADEFYRGCKGLSCSS